MVENLPASAGDAGSSPGLGRSHMPWSNWAREPQLLSLRVWSLCPATREAAIVRGPRIAMKSGPRLPQLEKALAQKRRPNTAKNKLKKKKMQPPLGELPINVTRVQREHQILSDRRVTEGELRLCAVGRVEEGEAECPGFCMKTKNMQTK